MQIPPRKQLGSPADRRLPGHDVVTNTVSTPQACYMRAILLNHEVDSYGRCSQLQAVASFTQIYSSLANVPCDALAGHATPFLIISRLFAHSMVDVT